MKQSGNLNVLRSLEDQDIKDDLKWSLKAFTTDVTPLFVGKYLALFPLLQ